VQREQPVLGEGQQTIFTAPALARHLGNELTGRRGKETTKKNEHQENFGKQNDK